MKAALIPQLSVIVSVYNEEEVLPKFYAELTTCLHQAKIAYELIFVNDGSQDQSLSILNRFAQANERVIVINLSKNWGHEAAMLAGVDYSRGQAIICLDADLQHPPSMIPEMFAVFEQGYELVLMTRTDREDVGFFRKFGTPLFYRILNGLSATQYNPQVSDFFLISARIAAILRQSYRERTRFLRGILQMVGFKRTTIEFVAPKRPGGTSKYSFEKLLRFSVDAILMLSNAPLRLGIMCGVCCGLFGLIVTVYSVIMHMVSTAPPGYTTLVVLISLLFAIQFFLTGIIGEYIGCIFTENKERPIYLIDDVLDSMRTLDEPAA